MYLLKKIIKYISYVLLFLITTLVVILIFISPISKWAIEKYDKKYVGREITIGKLNINLFKGSIAFYDLSVYETDDKTKFFSATELETQLALLPLLKEKYKIKYIHLSNFYLSIKQKGSNFNFDDLLKLGQSDPNQKPEAKPLEAKPTEWFLNNVTFKNGIILYNDQLVGSKIALSKLNVLLPAFAYNINDLKVSTDFLVNKSGQVASKLNLNLSNLNYILDTKITALDVQPFYVYLKEILLAKQLKGIINTNMRVKGSFADAADLAIKGNLNLNSFLLTDVLNDDLALFKDLQVSIDSINLKKNIFNLNTVTLKDAYLKVELYDNGTNFNRLMKSDSTQAAVSTTISLADSTSSKATSGASSTNIFIIIADYVKMVAKDYILNSYSADKVELSNLKVDYSDFTLGEQFYTSIDSLNINSSRINSENERITANLTTRLNNKGRLNVDISANPKDFLEMDFKTELKKLPITTFNPYVKYYLANTFKKGDLNVLISTSINSNHQLDSKNALLIEKIKCGKKIKGIKTAANVPLKLGIALLRDPKGNIDFKFPVKGNLNDPKYRIGKIVLKIFENLLIKAVTAPLNAVGALFSKKEPASDFEFEYLQTDFSTRIQRRVLETTANYLAEKPELTIQFTQNVNPEKEMEQLIYKLAKQKYVLDASAASNLKQSEIENSDKIDNKDSVFVTYINNQNKELTAKTSHLDKCKRFVGEEEVKKQHLSIITERENQIKRILSEKNIEAKRIVFVRNIDKQQNLNEVKPTFNFEMDSED